MMFFTNQIYSQENAHNFKVIGRMGVPIDDPRSTDPIFYLDWQDGIVLLAQNGYIESTHDHDGIAYFENMYKQQHIQEWSNKWLRNKQILKSLKIIYVYSIIIILSLFCKS